MTAFILPANPLSYKEPDYGYEDEYQSLKKSGFKVYLVDIEDIKHGKVYPQYEEDKLLYRGWMLNEEKYEQLNSRFNNRLIVDTKEYLHSHHIVHWYEEIKEHTFETEFTTLLNAKEKFKTLNWKQAFVKDYVKSIKTGKGSIIENTKDIDRIEQDMLKYK